MKVKLSAKASQAEVKAEVAHGDYKNHINVANSKQREYYSTASPALLKVIY